LAAAPQAAEAPALALTTALSTAPATPASSVGSTTAELGLPLQRHISADEYDGYSSVTAVAHTADGFTLFGTYHAAILYDGRTYEKIPVPAAYVTALCRDRDGVMWVGGDNEIGVIETAASDGRLRYASRTNLLPTAVRSFGRMRALVANSTGIFAVTSSGVLRFTARQAELLPVPPESRLQLFAVAGRVYLQDPRRGLLIFDESGFRAVDTGHPLTGRRIQLVERDAAHAFCLVEGEGLFRLTVATGRLDKIATPINALLAEPMGRGLRLRDSRVVFVRGNNHGVIIADPALQRAQVLDAKTGLANTAITALAQDADQGLWLGTGNGLLRLDLAPGLTVFDERNAFPIGSASSLVRHDGTLYAATVQGLMRLVPGQPATGKPARFEPDPRIPENCDNLRDTPAGLLFSTPRAVELLTPTGRRRLFVPPARIAMIKPNRRVPGICFIATHDGGFHVLNLTTGTTQRVLTLPPAVLLWNGADESDRVSWFGTAASGFWRITAPDAAWHAATAEPHPLGQAGLPEGKSWTGVFPLFDDLHFITETGMYRWQPDTRKFSLDHRFQIEGVNPLRFMPVVADATDRAWTSPWSGTLACARPLGYFQAATPSSFAWHDAPARWQAGVGRFGAGFIIAETAGDRPVLWTKSTTTIARIELDTLTANRPASPWRPVLRRFVTGDQSWPVAAGTVLSLPFSNLPITLRYAAPRYQPGAPIRYQTRLLGFREEWSAPAPSNETVFTNLTGGPFVFEVRALDADGFTSEIARQSFTVAPPWHRSFAAFISYVLGGAGLVVSFVRWRLRHAERERLRLEALVAARTSELAAANRAKSLFLANMSHELRTPLNGVIGYAQVLIKERDLSDRNRERLRIVQTSGEHLLRMINEVLDFSKIEAGKLELRPAPFHLPQLLADIAAALAPRAEAKGLSFTVDTPPDLPAMVIGDAQKLRQVLDNLLGNAVKFTATGGITLKVTSPVGGRVPAPAFSRDTIAFSVRDTGVGIAAADLAKLFRPFQQASDGRPPEPGTGLGLAICQRLVALMGGDLTVESTRGNGSTFSFSLPLDPLAIEAAAPSSISARVTGYAGDRRRVLVVDDVSVNRALLVELLSPLGFELRDAATAERALAAAESWQPHAVLLDLRMPGMDGFELARRLRALPAGAQPQLIAMSASVLSFNLDDAFAAGCDDFLPKPFREADLIAKLGLHLGLSWTHAVPTAPLTTDTPATASPATLDFAPLLAAAQRGEIATVRRLLAELSAHHPHDARLADLSALAAAYQMERLRDRLTALAVSPAAPT
jgi:signal transduction histidine kinase/DNA-binding response OmpR family regulator